MNLSFIFHFTINTPDYQEAGVFYRYSTSIYWLVHGHVSDHVVLGVVVWPCLTGWCFSLHLPPWTEMSKKNYYETTNKETVYRHERATLRKL